MVSVKLWGGIGNQLFQYAFGQYLKLNLNVQVYYYFDSIIFDHTDKSILKIIKDINIIQEKDVLPFFLHNKIVYKIFRKIVQTLPMLYPTIYVEKDMRCKLVLPKESVIYDGYWQSYKYSNNNIFLQKIIRDNLMQISELDYYQQIISCESVSLHVRRGDYLNAENAKIYYDCDLEYYKKSIQYILSKLQAPVFFIFSNDIDWVKNNFYICGDINCVFIDNTTKKIQDDVAIKELMLMSMCKHNIIANSTFSWWGAYLNANEKKIVISPREWFKNYLNVIMPDLIPQSWIKI